jgi:hypothetical protein
VSRGRPLTGSEPNDCRLPTTLVPASLLERLRAKAQVDGVSIGEAVRKLLCDGLGEGGA